LLCCEATGEKGLPLSRVTLGCLSQWIAIAVHSYRSFGSVMTAAFAAVIPAVLPARHFESEGSQKL
jgi:hypothetical protein